MVKKKSHLIFIFQCLWLWIIQAFNCGGMDYKTNELIYHDGGVATEWLADIFIRFFLKMGIDYMWYRAFWATVAILIIENVIWKYSRKPCLVMILYYAFLWADNIAQCRFFWASSFVLLAFHFMLESKKKLYYIVLVLATGFHTSSFIYLLFPLVYKILIKNSTVKNIGIIGMEMLFFSGVVPILNFIGMRYAADKFVYYLYQDNYSSIIVGLCFLGMYAVFFMMIYWIISRSKEKSEIDIFTLRIINTAVFILPFLLFNSNFGRFFRPILIMSYIVVSNRIGKTKPYSLSNLSVAGFCFITILAGIVLQYKTNWFAIDTMFANNYLLQHIF